MVLANVTSRYLVYRLTSPSSKSYIGLTKQPDVNIRWKQHIQLWRSTKDNKGRKTKLQQAFSKYDPETTNWTVECLFGTDSVDEMIAKEIELIAEYNTVENGYNINPGGDLGSLGREFDEEHKQAIAAGKKNWWDSEAGQAYKKVLSERLKNDNPAIKGQPAWNKGMSMSDDFKRAISEGQKGVVRKPRTKEHSEAISRAKRGKPANSAKQLKAYADNAKRMMGRSQTESQKARAAEANQKEWLVTLPSGEVIEVTNLRAWCIERGLDSGNIVRASGSRKHYAKLKQ